MTYDNIKAYQQVNTHSAEFADPHRLIQMLMEGFVTRTAEAKGAMQRGETEAKGVAVNKACRILEGLLDSLDFDKGPEVAGNLSSMYFYMLRRVQEAHRTNDPAGLDEAMELMQELKSGWDDIREEAVRMGNEPSDGSGEPQRVSVTG